MTERYVDAFQRAIMHGLENYGVVVMRYDDGSADVLVENRNFTVDRFVLRLLANSPAYDERLFDSHRTEHFREIGEGQGNIQQIRIMPGRVDEAIERLNAEFRLQFENGEVPVVDMQSARTERYDSSAFLRNMVELIVESGFTWDAPAAGYYTMGS